MFHSVLTVLLWFSYGACASLASARPSHLSLKDAIHEALQVSPDLKVISAEHARFLSEARHAMSPSDPTVALGFGDLGSTGADSKSDLKTYSVSQSFGFPGKASAQADVFEAKARAKSFGGQTERATIALSVTRAFYDVWLSNEKLSLNQLRREAFERILKIASKRAVKNTTTEVDYLSVKMALEKVENDRADLLAESQQSQTRLDLLLNLPVDQSIKIESPGFPAYPMHLDQKAIFDQTLRTNPSLLSNQELVKSARSGVTSAKRSMLPDFTLTGGVNNFNHSSASIGLSIPLWFWWSQNSDIDSARENYFAEKARLDAEQMRLKQKLEGIVSTLQASSRKLVHLHDEEIPLSRRAFKVALRNYQFGKIDFAVLTQTTDLFVDSQVEFNSLLVKFAIQNAELKAMEGRLE